MWLPIVRRGVVFCLLALYAALRCAPATAGESVTCCPQPRTGDQLWLVSHRGLGCNVEQQVEKLKYWRYDREKCWVRSDRAEFQVADEGHLVTTIFAHGNRIESCEAFTNGWNVYRTLVRCADERPIRFIIWSWPSAKVGGPIDDARIKASRTNPSAYYLARFVDQLGPQQPVSLWGHSFGARIVTGALHLLGGGQLAGRRLVEQNHENRGPMHAVLIAAALDSDWLLSGHAHGRALSQVDQILLVNNGCDALLKRYYRLYHRRSCRQALGYTGLSSSWTDSSTRSKIKQIDACCQVGKQHALAGYLCASCLMASMRNVLMFDPPGGPAIPEDAVAEELAAAD